MTPTDLTDYADRVRTAEQAGTMSVLGDILWYSVSDLTISHDRLVTVLHDIGLSGFAPKRPADSDIFRRVTGIAQKREPLPGGMFLNVLVRNVSTHADEVLRRVVVETVDPKGERLTYSEAYDLRFDKEHGTLSIDRLPTWEPSAVDQRIHELPGEYRAKLGCLDGNGVRTLINRVLDGSHAVSVRESGGVKFIPRQHAAVVDALAALDDKIPEVRVDSVPVPEVSKQDRMVTEAVAAQTVTDVDRLMADIREAVRDGSMTDKKLSKYKAEHRNLKDRLATYENILTGTLDSVVARLDVFDRVIGNAIQQAA